MSIDRFFELHGLPERYIEVKDCDGQWICKRELRDRFNLTRINGHIITFFLSGLMYKAIAGFRFIVFRVKRIKAQYPQDYTYPVPDKEEMNKYRSCDRKKSISERFQHMSPTSSGE